MLSDIGRWDGSRKKSGEKDNVEGNRSQDEAASENDTSPFHGICSMEVRYSPGLVSSHHLEALRFPSLNESVHAGTFR